MDTQVGTTLSKAMDVHRHRRATEALILVKSAEFICSEVFNDFYVFDGIFKVDGQ